MPVDDGIGLLAIKANGLLAEALGSFVDVASFQMMSNQDLFTITLRFGPDRPDTTISLSGIYRLSIEKPPEIDGSFIDAATVKVLPKGSAPWPDGADRLVRRGLHLPDLIWLQLMGPTAVDVVASTLAIAVAQAYL